MLRFGALGSMFGEYLGPAATISVWLTLLRSSRAKAAIACFEPCLAFCQSVTSARDDDYGQSLRRHLHAKPRRLWLVDGAVLLQRHAIELTRRLLRPQPQRHILGDFRGRPLVRVAVAAAARHRNDQAVVGRDRGMRLGRQLLARLELDRAGGA